MSVPVTNVHDAFFKQVLADPELAGLLLREHLPTEVAGLLSSGLPEPLPASFVDEQLREHHSDLLFRMRLKGDGEAFAYFLLEHKSSSDEGARLQLLRYVVRILESCYEQNRRQLPLPTVLPLLVHQGPPEWGFSCEFIDLFGTVPAPLRPYLPNFQHALLDLTATEDETLSTSVRLRALLTALKYGRRGKLPERLDSIFKEAGALEQRDFLLIVTYADKGRVAVSREAIRQALHRWNPEREEQIMGWISQPYIEEGIQRGLAEGRELGRAEGLAEGHAEGRAEGRTEGRAAGTMEGRATSLLRILEKRFGHLPANLRERIFAADLPSLDTWLDQAIDARDLQSVFAAPLLPQRKP